MASLKFEAVQQNGIYIDEHGCQISTYIWHLREDRTFILVPGEDSESLFHRDDLFLPVRHDGSYWRLYTTQQTYTPRTIAVLLSRLLTDARRKIAEMEKENDA